MHLPSLMQILGVGVTDGVLLDGYVSVTLVSMSLRFGSLLNSTICLFVNSCPQSALLVNIFQFMWVMFFMLGLQGL